jgi:nucleolar complex protein 2
MGSDKSKRSIRFLKKVKKAGSTVASFKSKGKKGKSQGQKLRLHKDEQLESGDEEDAPIAMGGEESDEEEVQEKTQGKKKMGKMAKHRQELESLQQGDPEFFEFLKQNDQELLDFDDEDDEAFDEADGDGDNEEMDIHGSLSGDDEDEDEDEDDDDDEDDEDEDEGEDEEDDYEIEMPSQGRTKPTVDVSTELLSATITSAERGSVSALSRLITIFSVACDSGESSSGGRAARTAANRFTISSPIVYEAAMTRGLSTTHGCLYRHLGLKDGALHNPNSVEEAAIDKNPRWKRLQPSLLALFKAIVGLLQGFVGSASQQQIGVFVLDSLEPYVPLLAPLPRMAKRVLDALLSIWAATMTSAEDASQLRAHAFLRVRQMARVLPGASTDDCMRSSYLHFARSAKTFSELTAPTVNFMIECCAELYALDGALAYQNSFQFLRQLALLLRAALLKKSVTSSRQVLSGQFLNCLRLWTRVVSAAPAREQLGQLIYPLSQVILGVVQLAQSATWAPLRFHAMDLLHRLAAHGECFIPTAARIAEALEFPELSAKITPSTAIAPRMVHLTKLQKTVLGHFNVRDVIVSEAITLLKVCTVNCCLSFCMCAFFLRLRHFPPSLR